MFSIRRIYDAATGANRERLAQVQAILRAQFPELGEAQIAKLPGQLTNPFKYSFRSVVFVAEDSKHGVRGFALMLHAPDLNFCYLDFLSTGRGDTGRGIGGALYQRVREDADLLGVVGRSAAGVNTDGNVELECRCHTSASAACRTRSRCVIVHVRCHR